MTRRKELQKRHRKHSLGPTVGVCANPVSSPGTTIYVKVYDKNATLFTREPNFNFTYF